jgi:hypothetical protein
MALNFPNSPTLNQVYIDTTSGFSYQWNDGCGNCKMMIECPGNGWRLGRK